MKATGESPSIVLLSAGRGVRMMPLTRNTPKCLLDIGGGLTVIESQLQSIVDSRVTSKVYVVTGYLADQVEAKLKGFDKLSIEFIYNPFYASTNNLISLWTALPYISRDLVVINGDNIFKPSVLTRLVADAVGHDIVMVIDEKPRYDEDDMKVVTEGPLVVAVSKQIDASKATGESIGMMHFSHAGLTALRRTVDAMVRNESAKNIFYLAALQRLMDERFPVYASRCAVEDWQEIDFHPDLELIRQGITKNFAPSTKD